MSHVETTNSALNGEKIKVTVRGSGRLQGSSEGTAYDFAGSAEGWAALTNADADVGAGARPAAAQPAAGSNTGSGWVTADYQQQNGGNVRALFVHIDLGSPITIPSGESIVSTFDYTQGIYGVNNTAWSIWTKDSGGTWTRRADVGGFGTTDGNDLTIEWSPVVSTDVYGIAVWLRSDISSSPTGSALLKTVVIGSEVVYGDAFYEWTDTDAPEAFATGFGLQVNFGDVSAIPPYTPTHEYTFFEIVTSGPVGYDYDTPYAYADGEPFSLPIETCFLGVP